MNRDVAFFSKIPKLLENYLFCTDEKMCRSIQSAFDLKIYAIKNMTFPSIIEELCKKAEIIKNHSQNEIERLLTKIEDLEKNFAFKCLRIFVLMKMS